MKTIALFGNNFTVHKTEITYEHAFGNLIHCIRYGYKDIYSAYITPSEYKREAWEYWKEFSRVITENGGCVDVEPFISSKNTFNFTVKMAFRYGGRGYVVAVTKDNNYISIYNA